MNDINIDRKNTREVLDIYLQDPEKRLTFDDLRAQIMASETQIRNALFRLEHSHILKVEYKRGKPRGGERTKVYGISKDVGVFKRLSEIYFNSGVENFLKSNYVNNMIKEYGFIAICNTLRNDLANKAERKLASQILLNHPALIEEFGKYPEYIRNFYYGCGGQNIKYAISDKSDIIGILSIFDKMEAIKFYRKTIGDTYSKLYRELLEGSLRTRMMEFVDFDVILSPFTSYPRNEPSDLLSYRPFERIYDDSYILDESDYENFVKRAYVIYSNFAEIFHLVISDIKSDKISRWDWEMATTEKDLMDYTDIEEEKENLRCRLQYASERYDYLQETVNYIEIILRLAFHYWNIESNRFDAIVDLLKNHKSWKCHIVSDSMGIQIIDLETDQECLSSVESKALMGNISLFPDTIDPADSYQILQPCTAFRELGLEEEGIRFEDVLEHIKRFKYW